MPSQYLTMNETAEYLGVSYSTVRRLIRNGDLPVVRLAPRAIRITREAVDATAEAMTERRVTA